MPTRKGDDRSTRSTKPKQDQYDAFVSLVSKRAKNSKHFPGDLPERNNGKAESNNLVIPADPKRNSSGTGSYSSGTIKLTRQLFSLTLPDLSGAYHAPVNS